jgi:hypothetical protein
MQALPFCRPIETTVAKGKDPDKVHLLPAAPGDELPPSTPGLRPAKSY